MDHVASKHQFWDVAPAAERIFVHVKSHPELSAMTLDFDYGLIDAPSNRAVAKFSCAASCKACNAIVWVTAATQMDGSWQISHSLQWSE